MTSLNIEKIKSTIDQWEDKERTWAMEYLHKLQLVDTDQAIAPFDRMNPFPARVLKKKMLNGEASNKEVYHLEISLEGSGFTYEPGDILGIHHDNPPRLVQAILSHFHIEGDTPFFYRDHLRTAETILHHLVEITSINAMLLKRYFKHTNHIEIQNLIDNKEEKLAYLFGHDVLDMLHDFPSNITFNQFIAMLTPRYPRLYSIASSSKKVGEQVHITIRTVRYQIKDREREGACSTFIADRIKERQLLPIFIEKNQEFKLPNPIMHPIVMVGAGVGVAPFRSFLQEIDGLEPHKKPDTWLFFGEQKEASDFLYKGEWETFQQSSTLTRIDTAFSRDTKTKTYVQHRMLEQQKLLWEWIHKREANLYICGDKHHMAKEVLQTLSLIAQEQGELSSEEADHYIELLQQEKRLQLDVF
ncbi:hypothetical protein OAT16_11160 [Prolixibacteraceae bacterium]|nr:hypothetical protein [Prolixibacteraceae bacterium]